MLLTSAGAGLGTELETLITSGMTESKEMIVKVIALVFGGIVSIILVGGGANFALRKIRSVFSWA